jgi:hypothetical protein
MSSRAGSIVALVLASVGFAFIAYLFTLACIALSQPIPLWPEWAIILETGSRPELLLFSRSMLLGLFLLTGLLVAIIPLLVWAGTREDAHSSRWPRRMTIALLVLGLPLILVAFATSYQIGS